MGDNGFLDKSLAQEDLHIIRRYFGFPVMAMVFITILKTGPSLPLLTITWRRVSCRRCGICPLCAALHHCWGELLAEDRC